MLRINQVFIFTAQFGELLMRMEVKPFTDEPAKKLELPEPEAFKSWQQQVEKRFKSLYSVSIQTWKEQENVYGK